MQGDKEVLAYMNELLAGELAARDQYFIHSRMYAEWGYNELFETRLCYARIDGGPAERHGRRPRALVGTTASLDWHDGRTKLLAKPSVRIGRCKETVKLSNS